MEEKFLLIIGCSKRKRRVSDCARAIEIYDGPFFRTIIKLKKEGKFPKNIDIFIISAKYGMLGENDLISFYDVRMTKSRAKEIRREIIKKLRDVIIKKCYKEVFINLGKDYLPAIQGFEKKIPTTTKILFSKGKIGKRLHDMREWILSKDFEMRAKTK